MRRSSITFSFLMYALVAMPQMYAGNPAPPAPKLFSAQPKASDIINAKIFEESLLPIGEPSQDEIVALAKALDEYVSSGDTENFKPMEGFLTNYPNSAWRASLRANLGTLYRYKGYYSRALAALEDAWAASKSATGAYGIGVGHWSLGELASLHASVGHKERVAQLLEEAKQRSLSGLATELISSARESLHTMDKSPNWAFRCGPMALFALQGALDPATQAKSKLGSQLTTPEGSTLTMNWKWAKEAGLPLLMTKRKKDAPVLIPSFVHLKVGHFAAAVKENKGKYLVQDPILGDRWMSRKALDDEWSGYSLIAMKSLPKGWQPVSEDEGSTIWGKGYTPDNRPDNQRPCDEQGEGSHKVKPCSCPVGMPQYNLLTEVVSLSISDIPVGYAPPRGPRIDFRLTYTQREVAQPQVFDYCNLGPKWSFNWIACLKDDTTNPNQNIAVCYPGGGGLIFKSNGDGTYAVENYTQATLTKQPDGTYIIRYKNGVQEYYTIPDRPTGIRRVIMTKRADKAGNAVNLTWDAQLRMTGITDALGQTTTLHYDLTTDPLKITKVTDPFGRSASFGYNANGFLVSITDTIGLTSTFSYGPTAESPGAPGDFINAMTTPYGTTKFIMGEENGGRWLETENPMGQRDRLERSPDYGNLIPSEGVPNIPNADPINPAWLHYRHSLYWDRRAYAERVRDFSKAHYFQWGHGSTGLSNGILVSERKPLETRVYTIPAGSWYDEVPPASGAVGAPAQAALRAAPLSGEAAAMRTSKQNSFKNPSDPSIFAQPLPSRDKTSSMSRGESFAGPALPTLLPSYMFGGINLVTRRARLLDDGTTQLESFDYDLNGNRVRSVDPSGRATTYVWSANQDLLEVWNTTGGSSQRLASYTYNAQHLPLTATDAAGQTTTYTYNTWGQVTSMTNPKNEATTFTYDGSGYLLSIAGSAAGSTTTFGYDSKGRVHLVTGPDGATVTTDYDNGDRPVKVSYSDGTYEQMVYTKLDLTAKKDRGGRWTMMTYNPLRHLSEVRDALGRVTHFDWCGCGGSELEGLTDPLGRTTTWWRDIQGRVIGKRLDDGTQTNYAYDVAGRLVQRVDAKWQKTLYQYYPDNNLAQVSYENAQKATPTVNYTYDPNYNRLASMHDGFGTTTYSYYPVTETPTFGAGRLASVTGPFPNSTITYSYDALGRVTARDINGSTETRAFDSLGRVNAVTNPLGAFAYAYQGSTGRLDHINLPNGQVSSFSYFDTTQSNRLQGITHKKSNGSVISAFAYTYDADGQIKTWSQQADANLPKAYTFDYDATNQLVGAILNGPNSELIHQYVYGYDQAGNRTSEVVDGTTTTADYNSTNQLTSQRQAANGEALRALVKSGVAAKPTAKAPSKTKASPPRVKTPKAEPVSPTPAPKK